MHVGIIGGGILGITLGYYLSREGARVAIYEASNTLGGLAGPIRMDGYNIDRFYHAILSSDAHLAELCAALAVVSFEPGSHALISGGAENRRRFAGARAQGGAAAQRPGMEWPTRWCIRGAPGRPVRGTGGGELRARQPCLDQRRCREPPPVHRLGPVPRGT